jgi:hypothetical protein
MRTGTALDDINELTSARVKPAHDGASIRRNLSAVSAPAGSIYSPSGTNGIQRHAILVGQPHYRLNLGRGVREHDAAQVPIAQGHRVLAIAPQRLSRAVECSRIELALHAGEERIE